MKRMNFINKLSVTTHKQASRWFSHSAILLSTVLIGIFFMQGLEFYDYICTQKSLHNLQTNIDALQPDAQKKQALENKKNTLAKLRTHIHACTISPCNPHDTLCMLTTLATLPIKIQSLQLHANGMDLTAHTTGTQHAPHLLICLKDAHQFENVELLSIQPSQYGVLMRIKGTIGSNNQQNFGLAAHR